MIMRIDFNNRLSKCCKCNKYWNTGNAKRTERYICPDCEKNPSRGMKPLIRGWEKVGMVAKG